MIYKTINLKSKSFYLRPDLPVEEVLLPLLLFSVDELLLLPELLELMVFADWLPELLELTADLAGLGLEELLELTACGA